MKNVEGGAVVRTGCEVEFRCRAVGRWGRCGLYEEAPYSADCLYLQDGDCCGNEGAAQEAIKEVGCVAPLQ